MPLGFCLAVDNWDMAQYAGMECTDLNTARVDFTVGEKDIADLNHKLQDELSRTHRVLPEFGKLTPKTTRQKP
jgi:hypothetical protein